MSLFTAYRPFEERGGQLYFHRAKSGPTYEISSDEKTSIARVMKKLRTTMLIIIGGFALMFVATVLLLPQILGMNPQLAFIVAGVMLGIGVFPFLLMVKLHLTHQKKIRGILGDRRAISPEAMKQTAPAGAPSSAAKTPPSPEAAKTHTTQQATRGMSIGKVSAIFLLGIAITTVGAVMLFGGEEMDFRRQLIWWLNIVTGSLLTGLGIYGMIIRQKPPISPLPTPRGDQSDLP